MSREKYLRTEKQQGMNVFNDRVEQRVSDSGGAENQSCKDSKE